MGRPKALVTLGGVPLVRRALQALRAGGCAPLVVVVGAAAGEVAALVDAEAADAPDARVVTATDWVEGIGASLRAGLGALAEDAAPAAVVHLVDLPGVGPEAIARLVERAGCDALARAAYRGAPGHPVLLGRSHWAAVRAAAAGDAGARGYLAGHPGLRLVECADVADPRDVDTPEALRAVATPWPAGGRGIAGGVPRAAP